MPEPVSRLKRFWQQLEGVLRERAAGPVQWEAAELEHIFAVIVMGHFVGLPAPPTPITLELLPEMEEEFSILLQHSQTAFAPLSELFSRLDVG